MALETKTEFYGLDNCQIFPILTDTADSYTLGDAINVEGVKGLDLTTKIDTKILTGDNVDLAQMSSIVGMDFKMEYAKLNLPLLAAAMGSQLEASGTTPDQVQKLSILQGDLPGYFQLQGLIKGTNISAGVNSARLILLKCKISSSPIGAKERDFQTFSMDGSAVFTTKKFERGSKTEKLLFDLILSETAESIVGIDE